MTSELQAIKTAYEDEGLSPELIAEDRDLDIVAVKAGLMQSSSKYRKACGKESDEVAELNFDNDQLRRVNEVIYDLALSAEDDHLRFKAASYIRDDKKGRKDIAKGMGGNNFNMIFLNEQLAKVRQVSDSIKQSVIGKNEQKLINV